MKTLPNLRTGITGGHFGARPRPPGEGGAHRGADSRCGRLPLVGVYDVLAAEIAAVAWTGSDPPAFLRFPVTQGLCGAALASRAPVIVGDVTQDPRYLTTFGTTRSEIVVPVAGAAGAVLGLIDAESDRLHAFADGDVAFLESCASTLLPLFS